MRAVTVLVIPAIPIPTIKRATRRMYSWSGELPSIRYPNAPATTNTAREVPSTLTFPNLSARDPRANPTRATAKDTCSMSGRAGATAAPPISMSIEHSRIVRSVNFVGSNRFLPCMVGALCPYI